jgi:hypothetical protein
MVMFGETLAPFSSLNGWCCDRTLTRLSHSRSVSPRGFRVGSRNFYPEMGRSMEIQNQEFFILLSLARRCLAFNRIAVVFVQPCSPSAIHPRIVAGLRLVLVIDWRQLSRV